MSSTPQQIINIGEAPNDGTGEPLRTAFAEVNNNFANVWAAGPVNTNVVIANSRVSTGILDQDLELAGNGLANVVVYSTMNTLTVQPQADSVYDLGNATAYYDSSYVRYRFGDSLELTGNVSASGNVTGNYILGNGSQLTGIAASYGNANVATFLAAYGSNTISTTGTITSGNILSNGYARLSGTFDESQASTSGLYLGYAGGTPRIMFGTGNTSQTFEIDNDSGTLRFYQPGSTKASLTSTGDFSVAGNITGNVSGFAIGYLNIPQVSFTGNATLAASDAGKHFYSTLSTANTLTIANNTSVSWAVGTAILVVNRGTANINIAQDTGVSLYLTGNTTAGNRVVTTYGMATLLNVAANVWMISGSGVI